MAADRMGEFLQRLRAAALMCDDTGLSDGQLLDAYTRGHDAAALEAVVRRHGPMVWGVCRRVLGDRPDAEDAFQATFLVLVRKAGSLAAPDLLANWLYGVAHQTARKARATDARRRARERQVADLPEPATAPRDSWDDLRPLLDRELAGLPAIYRTAVVVCDLEGKTRAQAARQLGVPEGTLAARLARGRVMLAKRLARHGLAVSGGSVTAALAETAAAAPTGVVLATIESTALVAAGGAISGPVTVLTHGVLNAMFFSKLKVTAAVLAAGVALTAPGVAALAQRAATPAVPADKPAAEPAKPAWREAVVLKHGHPVTAVAASAEWVAAGDAGGNVYVYDAKSGENRRHAVVGGKSFTSVDRLQFQPDGRYLWVVLNGRSDTLRVDLRTPAKSSLGAFANLGVSANGEWWLENHDAKTLMIRPNLADLTGATAHRDYEGYADFGAAVTDASFSPDTKWLGVVTADDQLRVFDRASLNRDFKERPAGTVVARRKLNAFAFSPDGRRLAVVGPDRAAALYDPATGKEVVALTGHRGAVHAVAFSPDGGTVATGGADLAVRLWDAATGAPLAALDGHDEAVRAVTFGPAGDTLVSGSADKTVRVWRRPR